MKKSHIVALPIILGFLNACSQEATKPSAATNPADNGNMPILTAQEEIESTGKTFSCKVGKASVKFIDLGLPDEAVVLRGDIGDEKIEGTDSGDPFIRYKDTKLVKLPHGKKSFKTVEIKAKVEDPAFMLAYQQIKVDCVKVHFHKIERSKDMDQRIKGGINQALPYVITTN